MVSFVKSVTFDCADPKLLAEFWAAAVGSNVDEIQQRLYRRNRDGDC